MLFMRNRKKKNKKKKVSKAFSSNVLMLTNKYAKVIFSSPSACIPIPIPRFNLVIF